MVQDDVFLLAEGDSWFQRNGAHLSEHVGSDIVAMLINLYDVRGKNALDIGCSDGSRLRWMYEQNRIASGTGIDPSLLATTFGNNVAAAAKQPLVFIQGLAGNLPMRGTGVFDLALLIYTMHWWDRTTLIQGVAEMDRVLAPGGYLLLADFAPDDPTTVPYKHREGLFTYKRDYVAMFKIYGSYSLVAMLTYNHDTHAISADVPSEQRGMCALLRKGE